jgi:hypothetical protein
VLTIMRKMSRRINELEEALVRTAVPVTAQTRLAALDGD